MSKNKTIAKLHFITIDHPELSHADQAIRAYRAGCKWVQLRMKEVSVERIREEALKILPVANAHDAVLLINDNPEIVLQTGAHGVHLGKNDMCPIKAREILGENYIIGGTANTYADILSLIERGVDYVGVGPFRFTTTKKNLSPIVGLSGYHQMMNKLKDSRHQIPVIAIGGIVESDITDIKKTGIHGIALASAIVAGNEIEMNIRNYQQLIHS